MNRYTGQTLPEGGFLVVSAEPDLLGNALVLGEVCPCPDPVDRFEVAARTLQETRVHCGLMLRTTETTYTKDTFPGGTPEEEAVWDAAPASILHTVTEENTGPGASIDRVVNNGSSTLTPCGVLGSSETWDPGNVADYTPVTYSAGSPVVTETDYPTPVDFGTFPEFEGAYDVFTLAATASRTADGLESFAYASQGYWRLDLSAWPTGRDWPTDFVVRGTLVWDVVTKTFDNDAEVDAVYSRERFTADYEVTAASRIWEGEVFTLATTAAGVGETVTLSVQRISGFEIWLPLD